ATTLDRADAQRDEPGDGFDAMLDRTVLVALLAHLAPRERRVLELRFLDELSQAEIAQRIGTSQVHVGRLIVASLAALRVLADEQHDHRRAA
ncbi:MAG: sigma-70 family RNA polymerase sigma factor, partial [Actinobacteria bacterium]|nr:sigma-70 family RNA polymerase sigma factor [Actinomycetota bacterium]